MFKPKNIEEWNSFAKEILKYNNEDGMVLYEYVFNAPYNHLDIDTVSDKFYKNFNLLDIKKPNQLPIAQVVLDKTNI